VPRLQPVDREIGRLALPAFGALVAEPLFLLVDAAVVGTLGTLPLAGLGAAATLLAGVVGLCIFLAYTTTAVTARLYGAGQVAAAVSHGMAGIWLALGLGVLLAIVGWPLAPAAIDLLGASDAVAPFAVTYLRISLLGLPLMLVSLAGIGLLRGLQDTVTPLWITGVAAAANAALAAWLVLGLDTGIAGSAWATVVAQSGAGIAYLLVVARAARRWGASLRPVPAQIRGVAATGGALFVRTAALRAVFLVAAAVAARAGDAELAAYQVSMQTWFLLALALDSLAIAGQAMVGRELGSGDTARARAVTRRLLGWGLGLGALLAVAVLLLRPAYVPLFTDDPAVAVLLSGALAMVALSQPIAGPVFVLDGVLIGAGDARWLAAAQLVMLGAFLPPAVAVAVNDAGLIALWAALLWFMVVRAGLLAWRAGGGAWAVPGATR
jgi:putative MATE family efflux protein